MVRTSVLERFKKAKLYCITMPPVSGQTMPQAVDMACKGGADVIQLREKNLPDQELVSLGKHLKEICGRHNVLFIVNDRIDVAVACGADGVHLGQDDLPISEAVKMAVSCLSTLNSVVSTLSTRFLIGCSAHSLEQAKDAEKQGASYVGCGPVFSTPTKPDYDPVGLELIQQYRRRLKIPFVAIGGIDALNLDRVIQAGAERAAVVRAVFGQKDIEKAARKLKNIIGLRLDH